MMPHLTKLVLPAALASMLALTACSGGSAQTPTNSDQLQVVVTTTQLADFAHVVGGDDASVKGLLAAGGSAHHFDPAPKDLLALSSADVLVVNGAGLEGFVESAVEASGFSGTIITAADGVDLEAAREITLEGEQDEQGEHGHEHGAGEHDEHGADEHGADEHGVDESGDDHGHDEHEHEHEHAHDHDHGDVNPHLWTSAHFAADMVAEIARGFAAVDPERAGAYAERAAAYETRLAALDQWIAPQFAAVPAEERVLVSGHDSLRYYLHDYDIAFVGSIMPGFEDNAEPSAVAIDRLVAEIKRRGVQAIFVESSMSPKLAQTIAREAGVTVVDADSIYADALGAEGSGAETYIGATVHNTRLILEAWGRQVDPLPETIDDGA